MAAVVDELLTAPPTPSPEAVGRARALLGLAVMGSPDPEPFALREGMRVGDCRLVKKLGEGGFGVVWKAEQPALKRFVALKIIKPGMDSAAVLARFELERRVLAKMHHPNVAMVLDAGRTTSGRPFVAMELVDGPPITTYIKQHKLSVRESVTLFLRACEGVRHAHQRAILHRDLKPSNILVIEQGGVAQPKVIDFGIAKALANNVDGLMSLQFMPTMEGVMLGTPHYMAPELAAEEPAEPDVRSDVYSLGAMLYEVLTGAPPLDSETKVTRPGAWLRLIRANDPRPPLARLKAAGQSPRAGHNVELDWIVMKALAKDPAMRFGSVEEFVHELERYQRGDPVTVGPPSRWYRARRYVEYHHAAFTFGGVILLSLLFVTGMSFIVLHSERLAREGAEEATQRAQRVLNALSVEKQRGDQITDFLSRLIEEAGHQVDQGKNPEALIRALDESTAQLDLYNNRPDVQAMLCQQLSSLFKAMNDWDRARPVLSRLHAIYKQRHGDSDPRTLNALLDCAQAEAAVNNDKTTALAMLDDALTILGDRHHRPEWFDASRRKATLLASQGRTDEAMAIVTELSQRRDGKGRMLSENHVLLRVLADVYRNQGDLQRAESTMRLSLSQLEGGKLSKSDMRLRASSLQGLARIYGQAGRIPEAIQAFEECVDLDFKSDGAYKSKSVDRLIELGRLYEKSGRGAQADEVMLKALRISRDNGNDIQHAHSLRALADISEGRGDLEKTLLRRVSCENVSRKSPIQRSRWMEDLRLLMDLQIRMHRWGAANESADTLWRAMQDYPETLLQRKDFARDLLSSLIATCTEVDAHVTGLAHNELLVEWKQRLAHLPPSSSVTAGRELQP